ncbi:hypothetical protein A7K91_03035 [Paenibacillus oryzae]|uniref:Uncharacterized protein n=1 Tax=Paenibacillus oryzae TaxID=1844972 RepID=A0A1A5YAJ1_9BACL|nr:hypothetical protein A7K91_03035 [Paenibacillus oryzae]
MGSGLFEQPLINEETPFCSSAPKSGIDAVKRRLVKWELRRNDLFNQGDADGKLSPFFFS